MCVCGPGMSVVLTVKGCVVCCTNTANRKGLCVVLTLLTGKGCVLC